MIPNRLLILSITNYKTKTYKSSFPYATAKNKLCFHTFFAINKVLHTIIFLSCGLDFLSLFKFLVLLVANWLKLTLLNFIFKIVQFGDGSAKSMKHESYEQGRTGKHKVSFRHVEFTIISIQLKIVFLMLSPDEIKVIQSKVLEIGAAFLR